MMMNQQNILQTNLKPRFIMSRLNKQYIRGRRAAFATSSFLAALGVAIIAPTGAFGQGSAVTYQGAFPAEPEASITARAAEASGRLYDVNAVVVTGDRIPVYSLENWDDYENNSLYAPMSEADIESFRQRLLKDLQDQGYLFATVSVYRPSLRLGFLKVRVRVGNKGDVTVTGNKWHTAEQVLESVEWETGGDFNYRSLYEDLFTLNMKPRMNVQTQLKPRVDADGRRVVDVEFEVKDRFPLHLAWNIANTGVEETGDWRSRMTVQLSNLVKLNETFTLDWLTDPGDIGEVSAVSSSFYAPLGDKWGFTVFGGFSESELEDILPALDITGKGSYLGFQFSRKLRDTDTYSLDLSLGWMFQESQNINRLSDGVVVADRRVKLSMPRITVGFARKDYDRFGGRNFINNTLMFNFSGRLWATPDPAASAQNPDAKSNLVVDRFSFARFQKLFGSDNRIGQWSLFFKFDSQFSNEALPSALYKGVGGHDTVRGYNEREILGDYGFNTTLELRTPLFSNFLSKHDEEYLRNKPDDPMMSRAQFVAFYDAGWVAFHEPLAGAKDDSTIQSVGLGMRLGLTKYAQARLDYGIPLESAADGDTDGRAHFSLQLQY